MTNSNEPEGPGGGREQEPTPQAEGLTTEEKQLLIEELSDFIEDGDIPENTQFLRERLKSKVLEERSEEDLNSDVEHQIENEVNEVVNKIESSKYGDSGLSSESVKDYMEQQEDLSLSFDESQFLKKIKKTESEERPRPVKDELRDFAKKEFGLNYGRWKEVWGEIKDWKQKWRDEGLVDTSGEHTFVEEKVEKKLREEKIEEIKFLLPSIDLEEFDEDKFGPTETIEDINTAYAIRNAIDKAVSIINDNEDLDLLESEVSYLSIERITLNRLLGTLDSIADNIEVDTIEEGLGKLEEAWRDLKGGEIETSGSSPVYKEDDLEKLSRIYQDVTQKIENSPHSDMFRSYELDSGVEVREELNRLKKIIDFNNDWHEEKKERVDRVEEGITQEETEQELTREIINNTREAIEEILQYSGQTLRKDQFSFSSRVWRRLNQSGIVKFAEDSGELEKGKVKITEELSERDKKEIYREYIKEDRDINMVKEGERFTATVEAGRDGEPMIFLDPGPDGDGYAVILKNATQEDIGEQKEVEITGETKNNAFAVVVDNLEYQIRNESNAFRVGERYTKKIGDLAKVEFDNKRVKVKGVESDENDVEPGDWVDVVVTGTEDPGRKGEVSEIKLAEEHDDKRLGEAKEIINEIKELEFTEDEAYEFNDLAEFYEKYQDFERAINDHYPERRAHQKIEFEGEQKEARKIILDLKERWQKNIDYYRKQNLEDILNTKEEMQFWLQINIDPEKGRIYDSEDEIRDMIPDEIEDEIMGTLEEFEVLKPISRTMNAMEINEDKLRQAKESLENGEEDAKIMNIIKESAEIDFEELNEGLEWLENQVRQGRATLKFEIGEFADDPVRLLLISKLKNEGVLNEVEIEESKVKITDSIEESRLFEIKDAPVEAGSRLEELGVNKVSRDGNEAIIEYEDGYNINVRDYGSILKDYDLENFEKVQKLNAEIISSEEGDLPPIYDDFAVAKLTEIIDYEGEEDLEEEEGFSTSEAFNWIKNNCNAEKHIKEEGVFHKGYLKSKIGEETLEELKDKGVISFESGDVVVDIENIKSYDNLEDYESETSEAREGESLVDKLEIEEGSELQSKVTGKSRDDAVVSVEMPEEFEDEYGEDYEIYIKGSSELLNDYDSFEDIPPIEVKIEKLFGSEAPSGPHGVAELEQVIEVETAAPGIGDEFENIRVKEERGSDQDLMVELPEPYEDYNVYLQDTEDLDWEGDIIDRIEIVDASESGKWAKAELMDETVRRAKEERETEPTEETTPREAIIDLIEFESGFEAVMDRLEDIHKQLKKESIDLLELEEEQKESLKSQFENLSGQEWGEDFNFSKFERETKWEKKEEKLEKEEKLAYRESEIYSLQREVVELLSSLDITEENLQEVSNRDTLLLLTIAKESPDNMEKVIENHLDSLYDRAQEAHESRMEASLNLRSKLFTVRNRIESLAEEERREQEQAEAREELEDARDRLAELQAELQELKQGIGGVVKNFLSSERSGRIKELEEELIPEAREEFQEKLAEFKGAAVDERLDEIEQLTNETIEEKQAEQEDEEKGLWDSLVDKAEAIYEKWSKVNTSTKIATGLGLAGAGAVVGSPVGAAVIGTGYGAYRVAAGVGGGWGAFEGMKASRDQKLKEESAQLLDKLQQEETEVSTEELREAFSNISMNAMHNGTKVTDDEFILNNEYQQIKEILTNRVESQAEQNQRQQAVEERLSELDKQIYEEAQQREKVSKLQKAGGITYGTLIGSGAFGKAISNTAEAVSNIDIWPFGGEEETSPAVAEAKEEAGEAMAGAEEAQKEAAEMDTTGTEEAQQRASEEAAQRGEEVALATETAAENIEATGVVEKGEGFLNAVNDVQSDYGTEELADKIKDSHPDWALLNDEQAIHNWRVEQAEKFGISPSEGFKYEDFGLQASGEGHQTTLDLVFENGEPELKVNMHTDNINIKDPEAVQKLIESDNVDLLKPDGNEVQPANAEELVSIVEEGAETTAATTEGTENVTEKINRLTSEEWPDPGTAEYRDWAINNLAGGEEAGEQLQSAFGEGGRESALKTAEELGVENPDQVAERTAELLSEAETLEAPNLGELNFEYGPEGEITGLTSEASLSMSNSEMSEEVFGQSDKFNEVFPPDAGLDRGSAQADLKSLIMYDQFYEQMMENGQADTQEARFLQDNILDQVEGLVQENEELNYSDFSNDWVNRYDMDVRYPEAFSEAAEAASETADAITVGGQEVELLSSDAEDWALEHPNAEVSENLKEARNKLQDVAGSGNTEQIEEAISEYKEAKKAVEIKVAEDTISGF